MKAGDVADERGSVYCLGSVTQGSLRMSGGATEQGQHKLAACGGHDCGLVSKAIPGVLGRMTLESGSVCGVGRGTVGRPVGSPGARRRLEPPLLSATNCSKYATCTQRRLMQGWPTQIAGILAVCGKLSTRFACRC